MARDVRLIRSPLSVVGMVLTTISAVVFVVVLLADSFGLHTNSVSFNVAGDRRHALNGPRRGAGWLDAMRICRRRKVLGTTCASMTVAIIRPRCSRRVSV